MRKTEHLELYDINTVITVALHQKQLILHVCTLAGSALKNNLPNPSGSPAIFFGFHLIGKKSTEIPHGH